MYCTKVQFSLYKGNEELNSPSKTLPFCGLPQTKDQTSMGDGVYLMMEGGRSERGVVNFLFQGNTTFTGWKGLLHVVTAGGNEYVFRTPAFHKAVCYQHRRGPQLRSITSTSRPVTMNE